MKKITKKSNEKIVKKNVTKEADGFVKVVCNRAYIVGESKKSVLFAGYHKDNTYITWYPKKLVFKSEYALTITISIPKSWKEYTFNDINGNDYSTDDLEEYMNLFHWKQKTKFGSSEDIEEDEEE